MNTTSPSLLERLRQPNEQAAWERFVQLYTPLLCHWAQRLGLHGPDADDLVQDVFAVLVRNLRAFKHNPDKRFRGWLWTVTLNKWRERQRRRPPQAVAGEATVLAELPGPDETDAVAEAEYQQYLVQRALQLMRTEFQPATWKAFWECLVGNRPAAAVAAELGISENAVYLAKGRVLRRLRQELQGLLD